MVESRCHLWHFISTSKVTACYFRIKLRNWPLKPSWKDLQYKKLHTVKQLSNSNRKPFPICILICQKRKRKSWKWYIFCFQNCSDLLWEKNCCSDREKLLKFEVEGREFAECWRSLEQFIQTEQFLLTECFLTCTWRFLWYDILGQLEFKWKKNIGI